MAKELNAQLKKQADALMKKFKLDTIYVNLVTGHMHSKENGARRGAKEPEHVLVYDGKTVKPAFEEKKEQAASVQIPEGEPSKDWTKAELVAYGAREYPDLKLQESWKEDTLLEKLAKAAEEKKA